MESSVLPFHLFRLPANSLIAVLRRIGLLELVSLSFCSKVTKNAVKSINIPSRQIDLTVKEECFFIHSIVGNEYIMLIVCSHVVLRKGDSSINPLNHQNIIFSQELLKLTRKQYFLHVFDILNAPKVNIVDVLGDESNTVNEFRELIDGITINQFTISSGELPTEFQKYASCHARNMNICSKEDSITSPFHQILIGNFDDLTIQPGRCSFDVLLNANSSIIFLTDSIFSEKEVNLFLKHWIRGIAHGTLKWLGSMLGKNIENKIDENAILKGLQYQRQPESRIRNFSHYNQEEQQVRSLDLNGGYDIQRDDGVEATLYICSEGRAFNFFVWNS